MNIQALFMCLRNRYINLLALFLFASCANIVSPQGGDKDVIPPFAKNSNPKDSSVNFKSKKIIITFSENIQLKEPEKNITISPSLKNSDFTIESEKNEIIINLKNLKLFTTYTIKANNSIADLTENNTLASLKYVFSTGQYLDSLRISGRVVNATNLQKLTNVQVGLYRNFSDSDIVFKEPDYYTFTDNQGLFTLDNISPGYYKLISIEDKNSNHLWNLGEGIAFEKDTILVGDTLNNRILRMVYPNPSKDHLVSASSATEGVYDFEFDSIYDPIIISQEDKINDKTQPWYQKNETLCNNLTTKIRVFSKNNNLDTAHFNYKIRETLYHTSIKTSSIKPLFTSTKTDYLFTELENPRISFNQLIDTGSIKQGIIKLLAENSTSAILPSISSDTYGNIFIPKLKKGGYKLIIPRATFYDQLGKDNDSCSLHIQVYSKEETQTLIIKPDSFNSGLYKMRIDYPNGLCNTYSLNSLTDIDIANLIPGKYNITIYKILPIQKLLSNYLNLYVVYFKEIEIKKGFDLEEKVYILYL